MIDHSAPEDPEQQYHTCPSNCAADSTIRLGHIGRYSYAWEDPGMTMARFGSFEFHFADAKPSENDK
jgi:hypothetical protein